MIPRPSIEATCAAANASTTAREVHLPRWVNEPLPNIHAILSGREIARLTRRPRWLLIGMAMLGQFPKQRTHCGKPIGWHHADVLDWLTQHMTIDSDSSSAPRSCQQRRPSQARLPLEHSASCNRHRRAQRLRCAR